MRLHSTTGSRAQGNDRCDSCPEHVPEWLAELAEAAVMTVEELLALSPQQLADLERSVMSHVVVER